MKVEKDFEEFIRLLNYHKVKYLIVGAYALIYYTFPRNTGDIDFFIDNTDLNVKKIIKVLKNFGFEDLGLLKEDFTKPDSVIQLGFPPVRIDLLTSKSGINFKEAFKNRVTAQLGNEKVCFISRTDLIKNKIAAGRKKDLLDLEQLEKF